MDVRFFALALALSTAATTTQDWPACTWIPGPGC